MDITKNSVIYAYALTTSIEDMYMHTGTHMPARPPRPRQGALPCSGPPGPEAALHGAHSLQHSQVPRARPPAPEPGLDPAGRLLRTRLPPGSAAPPRRLLDTETGGRVLAYVLPFCKSEN